ncbi:bifunctional GNAT family N-acetyltransferase/thioesterase [Bowmanella sp. JS7-9]|uniref:YiiD C-terminal domain-containing protein n=1 Tax=Pseudobowmanella zhangzhouensis TaxID=1537679 RepID=A0ABW1XR69_9ALTE|nr:bifunctional GNAT family N-acetyltransferase/thioesterase [Bowmanella sp. JS7-9]TBX21772.1 acetyltransferase [Bowmanella sp. JS7-9]
MFKVVTPQSEQDFENYYNFRWLMLRKPWNFPQGSEKDEYEQVSHHRMIVDSRGEVVAVGRLHFNTSEEAQMRHIAVAANMQGKGLGKMVVSALENVARSEGVQRIVTNSRDTSVAFFQSCGYDAVQEISADVGGVKRLQMRKQLTELNAIMLHPKWCAALQTIWHEGIPISEQMGIKIFQYSGRTLETRASLVKNINPHNTMFAGSIYSQAVLTGWGMIYLMMRERNLDGAIVLGEGNIKYSRPISQSPRGLCNIETVHENLAELERGKKAQVMLQVDMYDEYQQCGLFRGEYWVIPE